MRGYQQATRVHEPNDYFHIELRYFFLELNKLTIALRIHKDGVVHLTLPNSYLKRRCTV